MMMQTTLIGRAALLPGKMASDTPNEVRTFAVDLESQKPLGMSRWHRLDRYGKGITAVINAAMVDAPQQNVLTGVSSCSRFSCLETNTEFDRELIEKGPKLASPLRFPYTLPGAAVSEAAMQFNLQGPYTVYCGGPAASLAAFLGAAEILDDGQADHMLCVACDVVGPETIETFAPKSPSRALPLAEGAGALLLAAKPKIGNGHTFGIEGAVGGTPRDAQDVADLIHDALERAHLSTHDLQHVVSATTVPAFLEHEIAGVSQLNSALSILQLAWKIGDAGAALGLLAVLSTFEENATHLLLATETSRSCAVIIKT